jgi:hypothetical protein
MVLTLFQVQQHTAAVDQGLKDLIHFDLHNSSCRSNDTLENTYLMRLADRFSRRVRGYAKANGIPVAPVGSIGRMTLYYCWFSAARNPFASATLIIRLEPSTVGMYTT